MTATWIDLPAGAMNVAAGFRLALDLPVGGATLRLAPRPVLTFLDAGAPVARGAFAVEPAVEPPMGREVTLVGTQGIQGVPSRRVGGRSGSGRRAA